MHKDRILKLSKIGRRVFYPFPHFPLANSALLSYSFSQVRGSSYIHREKNTFFFRDVLDAYMLVLDVYYWLFIDYLHIPPSHLCIMTE